MTRKIAIVTGVSRLKGIGRAICCELAKNGFDIFFTYWTEYDNQMSWKVNENEPNLIQQEIISFGVKCEKLELDLSIENSIQKMFYSIKDKMGKPLVLINNATYSTQTNIDSLTATELDKHYKVNLKATTILTLEFNKQFDFNKNGRI